MSLVPTRLCAEGNSTLPFFGVPAAAPTHAPSHTHARPNVRVVRVVRWRASGRPGTLGTSAISATSVHPPPAGLCGARSARAPGRQHKATQHTHTRTRTEPPRESRERDADATPRESATHTHTHTKRYRRCAVGGDLPSSSSSAFFRPRSCWCASVSPHQVLVGAKRGDGDDDDAYAMMDG